MHDMHTTDLIPLAGFGPDRTEPVRWCVAPSGGGIERVALFRTRAIHADLYQSVTGGTFPLVQDEPGICVMVPVTGTLTVISDGFRQQAGSGEILILIRCHSAECSLSGAASVKVLHIPLAQARSAAAAVFVDPRKIATSCQVLPPERLQPSLAAMLRTLGDRSAPVTDMSFTKVLIEALGAEDADRIFPVSGCLKRVADYLRAYPEADHAPERLAQVAGVTVMTLRRNAKACLDLSLTRFAEKIRFEWVRERLRSDMENRSITALSTALGFRSCATFCRRYQRLFGETPTQTRVRAFSRPGR